MNDILDLLEVMLILLQLLASFIYESLSNRRFWVRTMYKDRDINGFFKVHFEHMKRNDPEQFKTAIRMSSGRFDVLLNLLREDLTKYSNRPSIPPECRLFLTLQYLAHGDSRQTLSMAFKMGLTTVRRIVLETCGIIWNSLSPFYISLPNAHEWSNIAADFKNLWNMPNCVGALDGNHVKTKYPPNSGSMFYNYKSDFSIILMGVCDANYTFTYVDIGAYGSQSDGGVFSSCNFGKKLNSNGLDLPLPQPLPGTSDSFPYYFVGDAAFPLKANLMRPFPGILLPQKEDNFNRRLSRARRIIENTFGILVARWRILTKPLEMSEKSADTVKKACVVLHDYLKMTETGAYCPPNYVDHEENGVVIDELWRREVTPLETARLGSSNNASATAFQIRSRLADYLFENRT